IKEERVPARYKGEFLETDRANIQYVDVVPRQVVGSAASLIPFVSHDEANRALMGTHMQCQAVPLLIPQSPVVGTGMEANISQMMGRVIYAPFDGTITYSDADKVTIKGKSAKDEITYFINSFQRTSQATAYTQKTVVRS